MFALVDGNNFFVSCERVFRRSLEGQPVVVLSNNDGCCIARSNEAKALGVKMAQPWHEVRHLEESSGLVALSANFALYGDMSDRMMSIAAGLGPTKTLAKLANHIGKTAERKPGSYPPEHAQVCDMSGLSRGQIDELLGATPVGDVWGVGLRIGVQLNEAGVTTALDLARLDPASVKRGWSVVLERTVRELQGVACIGMEDAPEPKKEIACTRSFARPIEEMGPLIEAVTEFAARAAEKLRGQGSHANQVLVFIRTSPFRRDPQYSRSTIVPLRRPCDDTSAITQAAIIGLRSIFRPRFKLAKAGVMLLDLAPSTRKQFELDLGEPESERDRARLMQALDAVNDRWGRGVLKLASGKVGAAPRAWGMKQDRKSPEYTTSWDDMPTARA